MGFSLVGLVRRGLGSDRGTQRLDLVLHGAVGALENGHQLGIGRHVGEVARGTLLHGGLFLGGIQGGGQVHMLKHVPPLDGVAGAVAAEDAVGGVLHIGLRVVGQSGDHLVLLGTGGVTLHLTGEATQTLGVGSQLRRIIAQCGGGAAAGQDGEFAVRFGCVKLRAHALQVGDGTTHGGLRHFQPEVVPRLQQDGLRLHQTLPHGTVGGLTEVAALGVFLVGAACGQGDFDIGNGRAGQHAQMLLFQQVGEHQSLPVAVELVLRAVGEQLQSAAPLAGFQN